MQLLIEPLAAPQSFKSTLYPPVFIPSSLNPKSPPNSPPQFPTMAAPILLFTTLLALSIPSQSKQSPSIYETLRSNGLPIGLLPKGVINSTYDDSGRFQVHLDRACNSKFENELHYDVNVSGVLSYGKIDEVSGISAQDLFMWFKVKEIRVDVPSSGLIYFDVGVVRKQFSFSSFDTPRDCLVSSSDDVVNGVDRDVVVQSVPKILSRKFMHQEEHSMAVL